MVSLSDAHRKELAAYRARAEHWFVGEVNKASSEEDFVSTLYGFIFDLVFAHSLLILDSAVENSWSYEEVRSLIESTMRFEIDAAFDSKHPDRYTKANRLYDYRSAFRLRIEDAIRSSSEWKDLSQKLVEFAEWRTAESSLAPLVDPPNLPNPAKKQPREKRPINPDPEATLRGKTVVSYKTAADLLGVTERRVRGLVAEGSLTTAGLGSSKRITAASLRDHLFK